MSRRKAIVYIDARNFIHGLKDLSVDGCAFDYMAFARDITGSKDLEAVKFYCAIYPRKADEHKHHRDVAFYNTLTDHGLIVVLGKFTMNTVRGFKVPREKGVDVRLATDVILDAMHEKYDDAYVISSDTDLIPAIVEVKKSFQEKKVFNFAFARMNSFISACDASMVLFPDKMKKYEKPDMYPATVRTLASFQDVINSKRVSVLPKERRRGPSERRDVSAPARAAPKGTGARS